MESNYQKVRNYVLDIGYDVSFENEADELLIVRKDSEGITGLVICCRAPIMIMEQYVVELAHISADVYKRLLQMNREIVHGAFTLDDSGTKVVFRDSLELETLSFNELSASFNSLSLLLTEFSQELIQFSK